MSNVCFKRNTCKGNVYELKRGGKNLQGNPYLNPGAHGKTETKPVNKIRSPTFQKNIKTTNYNVIQSF